MLSWMAPTTVAAGRQSPLNKETHGVFAPWSMFSTRDLIHFAFNLIRLGVFLSAPEDPGVVEA